MLEGTRRAGYTFVALAILVVASGFNTQSCLGSRSVPVTAIAVSPPGARQLLLGVVGIVGYVSGVVGQRGGRSSRGWSRRSRSGMGRVLAGVRVGAGGGMGGCGGSPLGRLCGVAEEATVETGEEIRWGIPLRCGFGSRCSCGVAGRLSGIVRVAAAFGGWRWEAAAHADVLAPVGRRERGIAVFGGGGCPARVARLTEEPHKLHAGLQGVQPLEGVGVL